MYRRQRQNTNTVNEGDKHNMSLYRLSTLRQCFWWNANYDLHFNPEQQTVMNRRSEWRDKNRNVQRTKLKRMVTFTTDIGATFRYWWQLWIFSAYRQIELPFYLYLPYSYKRWSFSFPLWRNRNLFRVPLIQTYTLRLVSRRLHRNFWCLLLVHPVHCSYPWGCSSLRPLHINKIRSGAG